VAATSDSLMGAAEKGPTETEEARERRFFKQVKEESAYFGNAERDHHGQANPRCRLKALSVLDAECGREGFHRFFSGDTSGFSMSIWLCTRKTIRKA
jgi:hypothetical protein